MKEQTEGNRPAGPRPRRSDDFLLPTPKTYPLVKPGRYIGVTTAVAKKNYRGAREYLAVTFTLFSSADALGDGEVLASGIPGFFNLAGGPASRYARLVRLIFPDSRQQQRLRSSDLIGKALEVEVVTVGKDGDEKALPEVNHYSKVSEVIGRA